MAIADIKIVSIIGISSAINAVTTVCGKSKIFHPDDAMSFYSKTKDFTPFTDRNEYSDPLKRLQKITARAEKPLELVDITDFDVTSAEINEYIDYLYSKTEKWLDEKKNTMAKIAKHKRTLEKIKPFVGLNIDLSEIAGCQYIKSRFGRIPNESLEKLDAYKDNPFILFFPCTSTEEYCYGMYFAPVENKKEIDRIFAGLYFEKIKISEKNGTPEEKIAEIKKLIQKEEYLLGKVTQKINSFWVAQEDQCCRFYTKLKELEAYAGIKKYASKYKDNFILMGWIPEENEAEFAAELDKIPGIEYSVDRPDASKKHLPPVKLKNNRFAKPFEQFIEMYGLPEYREFDPTSFLAITYTLFFGLMFGDLGQGIVLALVGAWLFKKKKFSLGPIMVRCGISASFFGVLYGSVFGFEHVLDPLYKNVFGLAHKPIDIMDQVMPVLVVSLALGFISILLAMFARIFLAIKTRDLESLYFGQNGIAGLVFYVSTIAGVALQLFLNIKVMNVFYIIFLIILPLLLIFFREPLAKLLAKDKNWQPENWGEYITQNIFELVVAILEYILNTVSFLRVGTYALSHVGLMMAVFIGASLVPNPGISAFIIIAGNLAVICVEGLFVGIQSLRLEFCEMFGRIFEGSGQAFTPVVAPSCEA